MAVLKLVPRGMIQMDEVRIDRENIGQLASTLVAALTSKSTCFRTRSADLANSLRVGTTWSNDGVLVGIQDFIILAESGAKVRNPVHIDLLREICLSTSTLSSLDDVGLTMTIAHYTRLILDAAHYAKSSSQDLTARQRIKDLIADAIPMVFIRGIDNV